jgi:hypothetical protein
LRKDARYHSPQKRKKSLFVLVPVDLKILVQNLEFRPLACAVVCAVSVRITSLLLCIAEGKGFCGTCSC